MRVRLTGFASHLYRSLAGDLVSLRCIIYSMRIKHLRQGYCADEMKRHVEKQLALCLADRKVLIQSSHYDLFGVKKC